MKFSLILSLLIFGACGKVLTESISNRIGVTKAVKSEKIDQETFNALTEVCQALEDKDVASLVGSDYKFDYTSKNCTDTTFSTPVEVETTLSNVGGSNKFVQKNTVSLFFFQDPDTHQVGILAPVCDAFKTQGAALISPIAVSGSLLFFTASGVSGDECPGLPNERCFFLERGISSKPGFSTTVALDWARYRVNTATTRRGFWTYKRNMAQGDCEDSKSITRQATLK